MPRIPLLFVTIRSIVTESRRSSRTYINGEPFINRACARAPPPSSSRGVSRRHTGENGGSAPWRDDAKDHSSEKTTTQVRSAAARGRFVQWQRTFDDVGQKNRLSAAKARLARLCAWCPSAPLCDTASESPLAIVVDTATPYCTRRSN